jgi:hypothetical protein
VTTLCKWEDKGEKTTMAESLKNKYDHGITHAFQYPDVPGLYEPTLRIEKFIELWNTILNVSNLSPELREMLREKLAKALENSLETFFIKQGHILKSDFELTNADIMIKFLEGNHFDEAKKILKLKQNI